jgi:hypothetical protein
MPAARAPERIRLAGYGEALENEFLPEFNEGDRLLTRNRGEIFKEFFQRNIPLKVIDQGLDRHPRTREARDPAHPFGILPDDLVKRRSLFDGHSFTVRDLCA